MVQSVEGRSRDKPIYNGSDTFRGTAYKHVSSEFLSTLFSANADRVIKLFSCYS